MFLNSSQLILGNLYSIYSKSNSPNDTLIPMGIGMFLGDCIGETKAFNYGNNTIIHAECVKFLIKNQIKLYEKDLFSFISIACSI